MVRTLQVKAYQYGLLVYHFNLENIAKQNGNGHLEKTSVKLIGHHLDIVHSVIRDDQDLLLLPIVRLSKGAENWVNGIAVIKNILSVQKIFNKSNWMYKTIVRRLTHRVAKAHFRSHAASSSPAESDTLFHDAERVLPPSDGRFNLRNFHAVFICWSKILLFPPFLRNKDPKNLINFRKSHQTNPFYIEIVTVTNFCKNKIFF